MIALDMGFTLTEPAEQTRKRTAACSPVTPKTHTPVPPLHNPGSRFYSPAHGRWVSRDPIDDRWLLTGSTTKTVSALSEISSEDEALLPPLVLHPYLYVDNEPGVLVDYLGLSIVWHNASPDPITVNVNNVRLKVREQLLNNPDVYWWFKQMLCKKGMSVVDLIDGSLDVDVYIRKKPWFAGEGQTKWIGVFTGGWPSQPDKTVAVSYKTFKQGLSTATSAERNAAELILHELSHWVEAYSLGGIWPGRPSGSYDTGDYIETLISW